MSTKRILLIVTGGIAAYKSLELVRLLKRQGLSVRAVMTQSATEFACGGALGACRAQLVHNNF